MRSYSWLRSATPLALAVLLGWWMRGADRSVQAAPTPAAPTPAADFAGFQLGGTELQGSLTLYNASNRTFYIYPTRTGSSTISCAYGLRFTSPGNPVQRTDCAPGPLTSR